MKPRFFINFVVAFLESGIGVSPTKKNNPFRSGSGFVLSGYQGEAKKRSEASFKQTPNPNLYLHPVIFVVVISGEVIKPWKCMFLNIPVNCVKILTPVWIITHFCLSLHQENQKPRNNENKSHRNNRNKMDSLL